MKKAEQSSTQEETLPNGWNAALYIGPAAREDVRSRNRAVNRARDELDVQERLLKLSVARAGAYGGLSAEEIWRMTDENIILMDVEDLIEAETQKKNK